MSDQTWFTVPEAAEYSRRHPKTVLKALEAGELTGYQNGRRGRWTIHRAAIDAWITGATSPRGSRRLAPARSA